MGIIDNKEDKNPNSAIGTSNNAGVANNAINPVVANAVQNDLDNGMIAKGNAHSNQYSNSHSKGTNTSSTESYTTHDLPAESLLIQVPDSYVEQEYVPTKTIRDLIQKRNDREKQLRKNNMDDQERERRKSKYLAWQNLMQSLGSVAGMGYAPTQKQDDSRVLASFRKLDQLRNMSDEIINDPYISWVDKLTLQQEIQHQQNEQAKAIKREEQRHSAILANQKAIETIYKETGRKYSTTTGETTNDTTRNGYENNYSTSNPDYLSSIGIGKPVLNIGRNNQTPIDESTMLKLFNDSYKLLITDRKDIPDSQKVNGGYITELGLFIPNKMYNNFKSKVGTITERINGYNGASDYATKQSKLKEYITYLDSETGYDALSDIANQINGNMINENIQNSETPSPVTRNVYDANGKLVRENVSEAAYNALMELENPDGSLMYKGFTLK